MESTTLMTFLLECSKSVRTVELLGSWDNFSTPYCMKRDRRKGSGRWTGCYRFKNIICDGDVTDVSDRREGGLMMGGVYWFYYRLDDEIEYADPSLPSTTACPLLPGQRVNVLEVPQESVDPDVTCSSPLPVQTLDPEAKFQSPRPVKKKISVADLLLQRRRSPDGPGVKKIWERFRPRSADSNMLQGQPKISFSGYRLQSSPSCIDIRPGPPSRHQPGLLTAEQSVGFKTQEDVNPFDAGGCGVLRHETYSSSTLGTTRSRGTSRNSLSDMDCSPHRQIRTRSASNEMVYRAIRRTPRRSRSASELVEYHSGAGNNSLISLSHPRQFVAQEDWSDIPEGIPEAAEELKPSRGTLQLRAFSPTKVSGRPGSRNGTRNEEAQFSFATGADKSLPVLAPLLEESEVSPFQFEFHLSLRSSEADTIADQVAQSNASVCSGYSTDWYSPPSEASTGPLSPTFSSRTEYSSGLQTPDRASASLNDGYYQSEDETESPDAHFQSRFRRGDNHAMLHHPMFRFRNSPESVRKQQDFSLHFDEPFTGYNLPAASTATLTRLESRKSSDRESTPRSPSLASSLPVSQQDFGLSLTEQLMDDFAFLGKVVN